MIRTVEDRETCCPHRDLFPIRAGGAGTTIIGLLWIVLTLLFAPDVDVLRQCAIGAIVAAVGVIVNGCAAKVEGRR